MHGDGAHERARTETRRIAKTDSPRKKQDACTADSRRSPELLRSSITARAETTYQLSDKGNCPL